VPLDLVIQTAAEHPWKVESGMIAIPVFQDDLESLPAQESYLGQAGRIAVRENFAAKGRQVLTIPVGDDNPSPRVAFFGLGKKEKFRPVVLRGLVCRIAAAARSRSVEAVAVDLSFLPQTEAAKLIGFGAEGAVFACYRFDRYTSGKDKQKTLKSVTFLVSEEHDYSSVIQDAMFIADATCAARDWVNEPPQNCTPHYLAEQARQIAEEHGLECKILEGVEALENESMNLFAAVGRGSDQPPAFIHLTYKASKAKRKLAFVGKGVTYDSGGYSLKPPSGQIGMHADMAGGAAVLGAAKAVGALKPRGVEIHFIIPCAENLVSGNAYKVNDVVTGRNGKSVEIVNTDAEGRLLLADSLTYASELKLDGIVDLATLTGGNVLTFGGTHAGLLGTDQDLVDDVAAAAKVAGEAVWQLPLPIKLRAKMKSNVADIKNSGGRYASTITAALFLREFIGDSNWAHLDIAGMARSDEVWEHNQKGATGFGVMLLTQLAIGV